MTVLFTLQIIFNQDERLFGRASDPVKFPIGAAFLDRRNVYLINVELWKVAPGLAKQELGSHLLDVDVAMSAGDGFSGADNTTNQLTFGSNLCTGPQNCVLENRAGADAAILPDHRTAANLRTWIDNRCRMNRREPVQRLHIIGSPTV